MKRHFSFLLIALAVVITSCSNGNSGKSAEKKTTDLSNNPFMKPSTLPFGAPDFTKIKDSDFQPAMEAGMKEQLSEVIKIANNPEGPTFQNTLVALEKSGQTLKRVYGVFNLLAGANTNPTLQKIGEEEAPKLAAHEDAIYLNKELFYRVKRLYNLRNSMNLDPESKRLVEYYYQQFELAGANLSEADKTKLKKLNEEEATLSAQFTNRLMAAAKDGAMVVDNKAKLAGLSDNAIQAAAQDAKANNMDGKYLIPLQNTTQQPALQSLTNRAVRHELFEHSWTRAEKGDKNDTRAIISRLAEIRAEQAKLLGFKNYAAWKLQDQMLKRPKLLRTS
ncbi:M3 family metallopeptidase [Prolixibacter bellariivorans]|uniref:M3 family metallopeptidase n=1 Tax=Prolixibacter bellariivorans TaxID=314319 RepID=UPI000A9E104D|nr:M3 family metallopeptidase [Prolixibacter bellariivorans]